MMGLLMALLASTVFISRKEKHKLNSVTKAQVNSTNLLNYDSYSILILITVPFYLRRYVPFVIPLFFSSLKAERLFTSARIKCSLTRLITRATSSIAFNYRLVARRYVIGEQSRDDTARGTSHDGCNYP